MSFTHCPTSPTAAPAEYGEAARQRKYHRGFTLVEIVLALGIASFSIVCMMGLLSASFQVSKASGQDTLMASMIRQVAADLHQRNFDSLGTAPPTAYYFDDDAHLLTSAQNAIYVCTPTIAADTTYSSANLVNLYQVQLTFASALLSTAHQTAIQTVHLAVARHG